VHTLRKPKKRHPPTTHMNIQTAKTIAASLDATEDQIIDLTRLSEEACNLLAKLSSPQGQNSLINEQGIPSAEETGAVEELKRLARTYKEQVEMIRDELHSKGHEIVDTTVWKTIMNDHPDVEKVISESDNNPEAIKTKLIHMSKTNVQLRTCIEKFGFAAIVG